MANNIYPSLLFHSVRGKHKTFTRALLNFILICETCPSEIKLNYIIDFHYALTQLGIC